MSEVLPGVRRHAESLRFWAESAQDQDMKDHWVGLANLLTRFIDDYEILREASRPVPAAYGDLSDLPPSLRRELSGLKTDELDDQIFMIVNAAAEGADLDAILIELWRRFKVEQTRRFIQNKTYRMASKGLIFAIEGRKGRYAATREQADRLGSVDSRPMAQPAQISDFRNLDEEAASGPDGSLEPSAEIPQGDADQGPETSNDTAEEAPDAG